MFYRWIDSPGISNFSFPFASKKLKKHPVDARRSEGKERQGREERRGGGGGGGGLDRSL